MAALLSEMSLACRPLHLSRMAEGASMKRHVKHEHWGWSLARSFLLLACVWLLWVIVRPVYCRRVTTKADGFPALVCWGTP